MQHELAHLVSIAICGIGLLENTFGRLESFLGNLAVKHLAVESDDGLVLHVNCCEHSSFILPIELDPVQLK